MKKGRAEYISYWDENGKPASRVEFHRVKWGEKGCRVFISGPMTGYPDYNRSTFDKAEEVLKAYGAAVFNPAWLMFDCDYWDHDDILDIDVYALAHCDCILHLPGWEKSKGAFEEAVRAKEIQMPELYLETDEKGRPIIVEG